MIKLKKFLIENKASKSLDDLKSAGLFVEINDQIGDITIFLNRKKRGVTNDVAHISMIKRNKHGNCNNSFEIISSEIKDQKLRGQGWGQFLYSLALEYASSQGSPLIADRESISSDALRIWTALNYHKKSGLGTPVEVQQMDDIKSSKEFRLTPENEYDDCGEFYNRRGRPKQFPRLEDDFEGYLSSPLTKSYQALATSNLKEIEDAGYLIYTKTG
jgi:hypothetical protein